MKTYNDAKSVFFINVGQLCNYSMSKEIFTNIFDNVPLDKCFTLIFIICKV